MTDYQKPRKCLAETDHGRCIGLAAYRSEYCIEHLYLEKKQTIEVKKFSQWVEDNAKPTNPKDAIGSGKAGTTIVPDVVANYAAQAFLEGALKYGAVNWSQAGVRVSIYLDAAERHLSKFKAGEWADPQTRVPHLASALACIGIILDANLRAMITDDRPPPNPEYIKWLDAQTNQVEHLKQMFADHDPKHYNLSTLGLAPKGKLYGAD